MGKISISNFQVEHFYTYVHPLWNNTLFLFSNSTWNLRKIIPFQNVSQNIFCSSAVQVSTHLQIQKIKAWNSLLNQFITLHQLLDKCTMLLIKKTTQQRNTLNILQLQSKSETWQVTTVHFTSTAIHFISISKVMENGRTHYTSYQKFGRFHTEITNYNHKT
jgi:hypothetical protein